MKCLDIILNLCESNNDFALFTYNNTGSQYYTCLAINFVNTNEQLKLYRDKINEVVEKVNNKHIIDLLQTKGEVYQNTSHQVLENPDLMNSIIS